MLAADKSDLYVLPEMWSTGFATEPEGIAESDGSSLNWMKQMANRVLAAGAGAGAAASASHAPRTRASSARRADSPLGDAFSAEPETKDVGDRPRMRRMSQNRRR